MSNHSIVCVVCHAAGFTACAHSPYFATTTHQPDEPTFEQLSRVYFMIESNFRKFDHMLTNYLNKPKDKAIEPSASCPERELGTLTKEELMGIIDGNMLGDAADILLERFDIRRKA